MWDVEWENQYFFSLNILNKSICLVCYKELKYISYTNFKRHYERCHPELHSLTGTERENLVSKLKNDLRIHNTHILNIANSKMSRSSTSDPAIAPNLPLKASYAIALALAKKARPFEDAEFFKDMCLSVLPLFGQPGHEVEEIINGIPLSSKTVTRRTENIGAFLRSETTQRIQNAKYISVCIDEHIDICDRSRYIVICVKTVDNDFNSVEEFLKLETFASDVTGKTIYESIEQSILSLIEKKKISALWADGGTEIVDPNTGFVGHFIKSGVDIPIFQRIMLQQSLFSKTIGLTEAIKTAGNIIQHLKEESQSLKNKNLLAFLKELKSECGDTLSFAEVKWLSRGKILQRLLELREEVITFLEHSQDCPVKTELLNSLKNSDFLLDLAFLCDITVHFNNLNIVLQGQDKNMCDALHAFNEFSRKLQILASQIASQNTTNFPQLREILNKCTNTNRLAVLSEELHTLLQDFQNRFSGFAKIEWILNIYNNPLTCSTQDVPIKIQFELSIMRRDLCLPMEKGIAFWKKICPIKYSETREIILSLFSMFSTTHICESTITSMVQIKGKFRRKMTNSHLETLLKIKCHNKEIDLDNLIKFHNPNEQFNGNSANDVTIKMEPL